MNEVEELITGMSDEDLLEAVEVKYANYTREALEVAQQELRRRQISFSDQSAFYPPAGEEFSFEAEPDGGRTLQSQQNIAKADKTFGYILIALLIGGFIALIYYQSIPLVDVCKVLALLLVFIGIGALVWKYVKDDVFKEILAYSFLFLMLSLSVNYFALHRVHPNLGSIWASIRAVDSLIRWYRAGKRLALWKLIVIIVFLVVYIIVDFSYTS